MAQGPKGELGKLNDETSPSGLKYAWKIISDARRKKSWPPVCIMKADISNAYGDVPPVENRF